MVLPVDTPYASPQMVQPATKTLSANFLKYSRAAKCGRCSSVTFNIRSGKCPTPITIGLPFPYRIRVGAFSPRDWFPIWS